MRIEPETPLPEAFRQISAAVREKYRKERAEHDARIRREAVAAERERIAAELERRAEEKSEWSEELRHNGDHVWADRAAIVSLALASAAAWVRAGTGDTQPGEGGR